MFSSRKLYKCTKYQMTSLILSCSTIHMAMKTVTGKNCHMNTSKVTTDWYMKNHVHCDSPVVTSKS